MVRIIVAILLALLLLWPGFSIFGKSFLSFVREKRGILMDLQTAYEILGLSSSASPEEVKDRYRQLAKQLHPDISPTQDSRHFVLLTEAYRCICDERQGKTKASSVAENSAADTEYAPSFIIREHIQGRFAQLKEEFRSFLDRKVVWTRTQIANLIDSAGSSSNLKNIVQDSVARVWIDMVVEIENRLHRLCERATNEDRDFLYALFSDLYAVQRRLWLADLYRNPTILFCVASFLLLCAAPAYPQLVPLVATFRLETLPWVTFTPLLAGVSFILVRLWQLNPRHQFFPPRLSAFQVRAQTHAIAQGIGQTMGEAMIGNVAAGAILGSFVVPGIGTLVGAGIGGLVSILSGGEHLSTMKERVGRLVDTELQQGVQQLYDRLLTWLEWQEAQYMKAATESFAYNMKRVSRFLQQHTDVTKQLTAEARLLLPGPEAKSKQRSEPIPSAAIESPTQGVEAPPFRGTETRLLSLVGNGVVALLVIAGGWIAVTSRTERSESPSVLASISSKQMEGGRTDGQIVVVVEKANLRSGPGATFAVAGQVRRGETVPFSGHEGEWYRLFREGQEVWIHQSLVKEQVQIPTLSSP